MLRFLARRLLFAALLVVLSSSAALLLTRLAPGDFASEMYGTGVTRAEMARERARHGLDRPVAEQFGDWARRALSLDFGTSLRYQRPVGELVRQAAANTARA